MASKTICDNCGKERIDSRVLETAMRYKWYTLAVYGPKSGEAELCSLKCVRELTGNKLTLVDVDEPTQRSRRPKRAQSVVLSKARTVAK